MLKTTQTVGTKFSQAVGCLRHIFLSVEMRLTEKLIGKSTVLQVFRVENLVGAVAACVQLSPAS